VCKVPIPKARLKAVPNTFRCVNHSDEAPIRGLMSYGHKTGGEIQFLPPNDCPENKEINRIAYRGYRRAR
jgi:hypothetical protein